MEKEKNNTADRELRISRLLDASIELVWEVWTKPEHLKEWWGPNGFQTTIHQMQMEEGSEWLLTMHGPDGTNYPNKSIFLEIIHHKKISYKHFNPNFTATVEFESKGDQTFMHWYMVFESKEVFNAVVKAHKADEGMKQNVEKLSNYLNNQKNKK